MLINIQRFSDRETVAKESVALQDRNWTSLQVAAGFVGLFHPAAG